MKKKMLKLTSLTLCIVLLFSVAVVPSSASYGYTTDDWDTIWSSTDSASVHLSPGSDPTQMNVAWFGSDTDVTPYVYVSLVAENNFISYSGYVQSSNEISNVVYKVTISGLVSGEEYKYYCVSGNYVSDIYYFETADEGDFDAIYVSDIHVSENEEADSIKNTAGHVNSVLMKAVEKNSNVSMIISGGDNADHGFYSEYEGLFTTPLVKSMPFASVCGNHDYKEEVYPVVMNYPNTFNETSMVPDKNGGNYWFVKGDVLFLMINGNWTSSTDHKNFVRMATDANHDVKWRVVVMHQDLYGGHIEHRESENMLLRAMFAPIFDEYNIDLVLMGHSHIYSRSHVLKDNKVVENLTGDTSVTDAKGTVYITSASMSRIREKENLLNSSRVAFDYMEDGFIYNLINFKEGSIKITAYDYEKDAPIDEFEIIKTDDAVKENEDVNPMNDIVHILSLIYSLFRNLAQLLGID